MKIVSISARLFQCNPDYRVLLHGSLQEQAYCKYILKLEKMLVVEVGYSSRQKFHFECHVGVLSYATKPNSDQNIIAISLTNSSKNLVVLHNADVADLCLHLHKFYDAL